MRSGGPARGQKRCRCTARASALKPPTLTPAPLLPQVQHHISAGGWGGGPCNQQLRHRCASFFGAVKGHRCGRQATWLCPVPPSHSPAPPQPPMFWIPTQIATHTFLWHPSICLGEHPMHLHGHQFWVMARGRPNDGPYNATIPLKQVGAAWAEGRGRVRVGGSRRALRGRAAPTRTCSRQAAMPPLFYRHHPGKDRCHSSVTPQPSPHPL